MSLNITGTPTTPGTNHVTFTVTDASGNHITFAIDIDVVAVQNPVPPVYEVLSHQLVGSWQNRIKLLPDYVDLTPKQHQLITSTFIDIGFNLKNHYITSESQIQYMLIDVLKHVVVGGYIDSNFGLIAQHTVEGYMSDISFGMRDQYSIAGYQVTHTLTGTGNNWNDLTASQWDSLTEPDWGNLN